MELKEALRYFTEENPALACMSIACGDGSRLFTAEGGVRGADGTPLNGEEIFDLASLSKLFTGLLAMRLWEQGRLDLSAQVTAYAPQFAQLHSVTVDDLLYFHPALYTPQRIDAQPSTEAALRTLFTAAPGPEGLRAYSDIHAMIARYVLEGAAGQPIGDILTEEILNPLGMRETFTAVPDSLRGRCVSCDREHRIEKARWYVRAGIEPGTVHDPKARAVGWHDGSYAGHTGLFSTRSDMIRLSRAILAGRIVSLDTLARMAENRTGRLRGDGTWSQFLGCLCYVRHPVQYHSEVPAYMGRSALALSGFTGNHLAVDPERGIFEFYLGSRVFNRLSILMPEEGRTLRDYGLAEDGTGWIDWPGEGRIPSSVDFVHRKDSHYHPAVARTLGL